MSSGRYTFLPELYDIFGREDTIKFLEIFAGCRVKVPSVDRLETLARDTVIYVRVEGARTKQRAFIIRALADDYSITEDRVRNIHKRTKANLEALGFSLKRR